MGMVGGECFSFYVFEFFLNEIVFEFVAITVVRMVGPSAKFVSNGCEIGIERVHHGDG